MEGVGGRKFFARELPVAKLRQQFRSKWVRAIFRISHHCRRDIRDAGASRSSFIFIIMMKDRGSAMAKPSGRFSQGPHFDKKIMGNQEEQFHRSLASEDLPPKLEKLYSIIPEHEKILTAVRKGREKFEADIAKFGFENPHMSKVHSYEDVEVQAFILGIPADLNLNEIAVKAYHTYGAHFVDDFFDRPNLGPSTETLERNCKDIEDCLKAVGTLGLFANRMAEKALHPEGAYKGLHRMIYGSLIQKTPVGEKQNQHLREFKELGLQGVDEEVAQDIRTIPDITYWETTKTVQEFLFASDPDFNMTRTELWNLIYAPALYYHDIKEEEVQGEINFSEPPQIEDMLRMIDIGKKHLANYPDPRFSQRSQQLQFLVSVFQKNLPTPIIDKYKELISYINGHQRKTCPVPTAVADEVPRVFTKSKISEKSGKLSSSSTKASDGQVGAAEPRLRNFAGRKPSELF